jgi:hypothetical protein
MGEMTTMELAKRRPAERGADWTLAATFFGTVAAMYGAIGYVVYLLVA